MVREPPVLQRLFVAWMTAVAILCLLLLVPALLEKIALWGHNIPQRNIVYDYLNGLIWALMLWLSILVWPVPRQDRSTLFLLWGVRVFDALGFMLLVENKYPVMDAWGYFESSRQGAIQWQFFLPGGGSDNLVSLARVLRLFLPDSYHGMKVTFSLMGLVAVYVFYRAAVMFLGREDRRLLYLLGLWPSLLFWSSILGKDPLVLLGVAIYAYGAVAWYRLRRLRFLLLAGAGVLFAVSIRFWLGPVMLASLAVLLALSARGVVAKGLLTLASVAVLLIATWHSSQAFNIHTEDDLLWTMERMDQVAGGLGGSGQTIPFDLTQPEQAARFLPIGMFTALFRPLPGEVRNAFGWLAGLDDLALLALAAIAAMRCRWRKLRHPVVVSMTLLVGAWSILYAPVSYLNLGMGDRYRCQIMPVMICLCLYLAARRGTRRDLAELPE